MDLYDPKYLRCTWDDSLEGKNVFYGDRISSIIEDVESGTDRGTCSCYSGDTDFPFRIVNSDFTFAYYDPQYDVKAAYYLLHKALQFKSHVSGNWVDCTAEPRWEPDHEYRIKPDVPKLVPYGSASELVEAYRKKHSIPDGTMPFMWLRRKPCGGQSMVVSVDFYMNRVTLVNGDGCELTEYDMDDVLQHFMFLDGSPCGRQAEE